MSAGDQKAIVVENGSYLIKAGFGGEDSPIAVFPAVVGTVQNQLDSKEFFVGDEARIKTGGDLRLNYPIDMGFVCNWEDMEKVSYAFITVLLVNHCFTDLASHFLQETLCGSRRSSCSFDRVSIQH